MQKLHECPVPEKISPGGCISLLLSKATKKLLVSFSLAFLLGQQRVEIIAIKGKLDKNIVQNLYQVYIVDNVHPQNK